MNRIRPEEMISVRNRRYPSGIDRIRCLKPLTFVIDVMNVDGGDERLTAHPDVLIQNGFSSFRCQTETRSNLPNLADTSHLPGAGEITFPMALSSLPFRYVCIVHPYTHIQGSFFLRP